jgi:hypothetical protein
MAASLGFTIFGALVKDWVFVACNALMLRNRVLGYLVLVRNRRRNARATSGGQHRWHSLGAAPHHERTAQLLLGCGCAALGGNRRPYRHAKRRRQHDPS